jgi:hypothetical protein
MRNRKVKKINIKKSPLLRQTVKRQKKPHDKRKASLPQGDLVAPVTTRPCDTSLAEIHASLLNDGRAGLLSRAGEALLQLQRQQGNRYLQRVAALAEKAKGETEITPGMKSTIAQLQGAGTEKTEKRLELTLDPTETLKKNIEEAWKTGLGKKTALELKGAKTAGERVKALETFAAVAAATYANEMKIPKEALKLAPKILKVELGKDYEIGFQPIAKGKLGEMKDLGGMAVFTVKGDWDLLLFGGKR